MNSDTKYGSYFITNLLKFQVTELSVLPENSKMFYHVIFVSIMFDFRPKMLLQNVWNATRDVDSMAILDDLPWIRENRLEWYMPYQVVSQREIEDEVVSKEFDRTKKKKWLKLRP